MAKQNRATSQQEFDDFINRQPPFDGDPLIQKTEHNTVVGDNLMDSVVFSITTDSNINSPAAAFSVDFNVNDQFNIDTTGVGTTAFTITLQNLDGNRTGLLNITKKSNDTFAFANGVISPSDNNNHQLGQTTILYTVKIIGSSYVVRLEGEQKPVINEGNSSVSLTTIKTKIIEIGDWNMVLTTSLNVAHGLTLSSIRSVFVLIRNDANSFYSNLGLFNNGPSTATGGSWGLDSTNVQLRRESAYNNTNYNSTSYNRGWITIIYEE